ncbi:hypothetical protein GH714_001389 [Hevea brasiliensis]|uniref:L-ascorbate peroxidase n=1 Tax=Hevea brasiliensis TaxID=3981 RepID=A0A6A6L9E5_HEVBR|nr:hypothetical protein GH714_001389 [Hevea brasiliensis]
MSTVAAASDPAQLKSAREDIKVLLKSKFCHPILVRIGWHDAGTYNKNIEEWPKRGGANGSLRFEIELKHGANAGLVNALNLLQPIKDKYSGVTYADLFQLASATAIEEAGGPKIPMKYGRVDISAPEQCPEEGRLPSAGPPKPADHLREIFYRMGLNDQEIVALSGAHTLGRSRPDRSGWGKPETKYTKNGPGAPGGQSWTVEWLKFDNSYFKDIKERRDEDLLVLPTDAVIFEDPSFKYMPRNMLKIRRRSSRTMLKPMPSSATLEPNLILPRIKKQVTCFVVLYLLIIQDEAIRIFFKGSKIAAVMIATGSVTEGGFPEPSSFSVKSEFSAQKKRRSHQHHHHESYAISLSVDSFGLHFLLGSDMGCGGSKVDDLPLVTRCRERKELIKAASDHRYALAAAHVLYFQSLRMLARQFGDSLMRSS